MTETKTNTFYQCKDGDKVLCTIERTEENVFRAVNSDTDITCEVIKIDEYKTSVSCIQHKRRGKDGKYRKTSKLLDHNMNWLLYMLENKGFIEPRKAYN